VNVFIQGMRRSGTSVLYESLRRDPALRCFYEPLREQSKRARAEPEIFAETRALRERFRDERYPSVALEDFNFGGPGDPRQELEPGLPSHCRDLFAYLLELGAPAAVIKETRMHSKVALLADLDPDALLVHVVRDPRAVAASMMFGRRRRHRHHLTDPDAFFAAASDRGLWSSRPISELLLARPEHRGLGDPPDHVRILLVWRHTFEATRRDGERLFGGRYLLVRNEDLRADPEAALAPVYATLGRDVPPEVRDWAAANVHAPEEPFAPDDPRWRRAVREVGLDDALATAGYDEVIAPPRAPSGARPTGSSGGDPARAPFPFVVGAARSGTTLLRLMLDSHPELAIPPETKFVPDLLARAAEGPLSSEALAEAIVSARNWRDFGLDADELLARLRTTGATAPADAIREFFRLYAERAGKLRYGDKTPGYVDHMEAIAAAMPEARFVHLVRDGRDVALSLTERAERRGARPAPPRRMARKWRRRIRRARRQAASLPAYLELRYEDLVAEPETKLREVCRFLELEYDPAMLAYHERAADRIAELSDVPAGGGRDARSAAERHAAHALTSEPPRPERIGRWKAEMAPAQREAFERVAGDLLRELGYETAATPGDADGHW
jgi:hypothetical protein